VKVGEPLERSTRAKWILSARRRADVSFRGLSQDTENLATDGSSAVYLSLQLRNLKDRE
jgi:hypothetical protein